MRVMVRWDAQLTREVRTRGMTVETPTHLWSYGDYPIPTGTYERMSYPRARALFVPICQT